jgi:hypothetical protein
MRKGNLTMKVWYGVTFVALLGMLDGCQQPPRSLTRSRQVRDMDDEAVGLPELRSPTFRFEPAAGLGLESGVCRRDPSDVIKVGETYYLWYTKVCNVPDGQPYPSGYGATVWYATSGDGKRWTEQGQAVGKGGAGAWDEHGVFTPNILVADGRYYLFYTGVPKPFIGKGPNITKTAIGIAASDSPEGPWVRLESNPVLRPSDDPTEFDSLRVDDSCLIVRDGKCWLYYKGRQWGRTWRETKMGVALADQPTGPYVKRRANPVVDSGHEVLVWPHRGGVAALISPTGPQARTEQYAPDGIHFRAVGRSEEVPYAPGAYRPDAFDDTRHGYGIRWGISMVHDADLYLVHYECDMAAPARAER